MRRMLPEPVVRLTQFYRARESGEQYRGTCGQTALAVCLGAAHGTPKDFEGVGELMIAITQDMIHQGSAAPNGAATLAAYAQAARDRHAIIHTERAYGQLRPGEWQELLHAQAGVRPILLQVAHGAALTDAETGAQDEASLRFHAFAIVGQQADGVYCATDGDHPEVTRRFQVYPAATLAEAQPCGILILEMQR